MASETPSSPLGRYVVADPRICHGRLTFRGTRVLVADVLDQVADGEDWEAIVASWRGTISKEAIPEAIRLARDVLVASNEQWRLVAPSA